ncbi:hypothetical protein [Streptomyces violascens]|uniref:hypothetical protein n=1 Tax=Streptomyces violascens TaxID=67381 RepID=UPI0036C79965
MTHCAASSSSTTPPAAAAVKGWPARLPEWCRKCAANSPCVSAMPICCAYAITAYARSCRGVRSSEAATGSHTNASTRDTGRVRRTADKPRPPGSVRRTDTSSITPSGAGRDNSVNPRSTDAFDNPTYAAIVAAFASHPSGRAPRAFTFTYTDNATSA